MNFNLQSFNPGGISFEEYPVTFDNEFYFVIREAGKVQILEIKDESGLTSVERVYADSSYFSFSSFQQGSIDFGAINEADLIVINGLSTMDGNLQGALLSYKENGGSLLLIPGNEGLPPAASLLATNIAIHPASIQEPVRLTPIQQENPFFNEIFEGEQVNFDMPRASALQSWS